jgi:hypothetical protein
MDIAISGMHRGLRLPSFAAVLITVVANLSLAADGQTAPAGDGAVSSDTMLPPNVAVSVNVVTRLFPEVTQEAATGQNATAVGNPKATLSVIYADNHSSKKVTISVDQYASPNDASSAYDSAVQKSRTVPGFKPISAPNVGPHAFVGTVSQGAERHIGAGALDGTGRPSSNGNGWSPSKSSPL